MQWYPGTLNLIQVTPHPRAVSGKLVLRTPVVVVEPSQQRQILLLLLLLLLLIWGNFAIYLFIFQKGNIMKR
jgi:hypothetical protein